MKKILCLVVMLYGVATFAQTTVGDIVSLNGGMTVKIDTNSTTATLTLTGPSTSWLGIGFGGTDMSTVSDMFIWNASANRDYTPSGFQSAPSADATQSWTVISDTVSGTTRTVVATRALVSTGDYTFTNDTAPIKIISTRGNATNLSYHGNNGNRSITTIIRSFLGVDDINSKKVITAIYPNPAKEYFTIQSTQKVKVVSVFDATGKKVKSFSSNAEKYNISILKSGVYFLEITTENGESHFEKFLKN
jgi:hypothetical protein